MSGSGRSPRPPADPTDLRAPRRALCVKITKVLIKTYTFADIAENPAQFLADVGNNIQHWQAAGDPLAFIITLDTLRNFEVRE